MKWILGVAASLFLIVGLAIPASASTSKAATQYLNDTKPMNRAIARFNALADKATTPAKTSAAVKPLEKAYETFDHRILVQTWPKNASAAIKNLYAADVVMMGDLAGVAAINVFTYSQWEITSIKDGTADNAAVAIVRHVLGLPTVKS